MKFREKLKQCVHIISTQHIFFTGKLMAIPHYEDDTIKTAHTDGKSITYNPDFFDSLTVKQRVTLIVHELGHIIFCHHLRMRGRDPELWNVATDHAINLLLSIMGFEPLNNWLCDHKFKGKSAEDIYAILEKEDKSEQDKQKQQSNDSGGSFSEPENDNGSKMTSEELEEEFGESAKSAQEAYNAMKRSLEGVKKSEELKPAEKSKRIETMGKGFSELVSQLTDIHESRIDWDDVMNRFLLSNAANDFTFDEPELDLMESTGFYFPSIENKEFGNVGMALDVSGSLHYMAKQVASEALHTLLNVDKHELHLFYVSTHIHKEEIVTNEDEIEEVKGGGTCFTSFFNRLEENDFEFEGLIFLTDGYVTDMDRWVEPTCPVLWILTEKNELFESNVPFGECVRFN